MTSVNPTFRFYSNFVKSVAPAALFLCLLAGCGSKAPAEESVTFAGRIMGTAYQVKVVAAMDEPAIERAGEAIEGALKRVDEKMSTYKPESELSRLNAHAGGDPFTLSEETFALIVRARTIGEETRGAFDITVGPLVNAWGFGPKDLETAPSEETLAALRELTGPDKITLDAGTNAITKAADGVYCDLSAIAKGYAVDQVAIALGELGHTRFMVEVGGEVRTAGLNTSGLPWRIAIEKPLDGQRSVQQVVGLSDVSLATSGNYRNFYEADGKRISHTISPRTGRPVEHSLASVSVIHAECALADAYATALMVLGPEEGLAFAEARGLAVLFILHGEGDTFVSRQTPAFEPYQVAP